MGVDYTEKAGIGIKISKAEALQIVFKEGLGHYLTGERLTTEEDIEDHIEERGVTDSWGCTINGQFSHLEEIGESNYTGEEPEFLLCMNQPFSEKVSFDTLPDRLKFFRRKLDGMGFEDRNIDLVTGLLVD